MSSYTINYLEYNEIQEEKISFKKDEHSSRILSYYQYPDGKVRRLYIRSPFVPISLPNMAKYLTDDEKNKHMRIVLNLSDQSDEHFRQIIDMINNKMNTFEINPTRSNLMNPEKLMLKAIVKNPGISIYNYNVSKDYPEVEEINNLTYAKLSSMIPYRKKDFHKEGQFIQKEGRFIFSPIIWPIANTIVAYKVEIKYKGRHIKSVLDKNEKIIERNITVIDL